MVTRVIFLDVDGVLHPLNPKGHPLHAEFGALLRRADQESEHEDDLGWIFPVLPGEFTAPQMLELARVVRLTGAAIVLSSTWRESEPTRLAVSDQLDQHGIGAPVGCTTRVGNGSTAQRASEITQWLAAHPTVSSWVAVDDATLTGDWLVSPLDSEHVVQCNPALGLTAADAEKMIQILIG